MMKNLIINVARLEQLRAEQEVLVLDLSARETYEQQTIPQAQWLNYEALISGEQPFPHKTPAPLKFAAALAAVGYSHKQPVVAFDEELGLKAARLYWTMRLAGLTNFSYLNGGLAAWRAAGKSVVAGSEIAAAVAGSPMELSWQQPYLLSAAEIDEDLPGSNPTRPEQDLFIWDARSYEEWVGEARYAERAGRIPGSAHLEWKDFLTAEGLIKPQEAVKAKLQEFLAMSRQGQRVVAYCQAHRRSAMAFMLAAYAGIEIMAYDGAWAEWGNLPELPVESGPK